MLRRASLLAACALFAAHGAGQTSDLPPRETFLRELRDAVTRSQQLWHRYAYMERRTELHLNPFGRILGTGGTRLTEVRPAADPRLTYRRVIERNGVPVPRSELDRQEAEYQRRVAGITRETGDDVLARRRAQMLIDDVDKTLRFDLVRREMRDGRPAIVVAFTRRPGARPTTREGRLAAVFTGQLWVDDATRNVMHVDAVAQDDVSFGGFVAKVYQGTKAVVTQQEIDPGVWMPTRLTLSGEFRALFRKAKIDHVIEWFEYRRTP